VGRLPSPIQVAELGSGSGKKTRWILEALSGGKDVLHPSNFAFGAGRVVERTRQIDMVSIVGHEQPYGGIAHRRRRARRAGPFARVVSGEHDRNFDRDAGDTFLREMKRSANWRRVAARHRPGKKALSFSCWLTTILRADGGVQSELCWRGSIEKLGAEF